MTKIVDGNFDIADIMFSDKVYFDLFGNVNKQKVCCYLEANPKVTVEKSLNLPRQWCAVDAK